LLASERRTDGIPATADGSLLASLQSVRGLIARALADDRG
jgi:hypothetical protein